MKPKILRTLALVSMLFSLTLFVTNVSAQVQTDSYWLIDLGTLPGDVGSVAFDINNLGQSVGRSTAATGAHHAVLWENGIIIDLGMLPDDEFSEARAINNQGEIVGLSGHHAVLWENGNISDLGMPLDDDSAVASGINERGQIIGTSGGPLNAPHAILWENGAITDLGIVATWFDSTASPVGRLDFSHAYGINERGQIVGVSTTSTGVHAVLWENGTTTDLGTLPGHNYSEAFGINDRGQIMGLSGLWTDDCNVGECSAVLWENGTIRDLGVPMTGWGLPSGINNRGQIVFASFQSYLGGEGFNRALIWDNGAITDLGALTPPGSGLSGAFGNNDRGQVVGFSVEVIGAALWTR